MNWWGWMVAGAVMLGAEMAFIDAQFYLVFVGGAAIIVGLLALALPALAPWIQWAAFTTLTVLSMLLLRERIYRYLRGTTSDVRLGPAGSWLSVPVALAPGESCQLEHGGTFWTARNEGEAPIAAGARARIAKVHGLTLVLRADS